MSTILVAGLINIETTLRVDGFPIHYHPVRYPFHGINSTVSGVGYNVTKALTTLGDTVRFISMVGHDAAGRLVLDTLGADGLSDHLISRQLSATPQSVILYDADGQRQINTDLKDIQEQHYAPQVFSSALQGVSLAVLCNINFARPFLQPTRESGIPIATDLHALSDLNDPYNRDWLETATILFMSHERLPETPETWVRMLLNQYPAEIIVIGMGAQGALLAVRQDHFMERLPAHSTRPIVNTIGAGDALFSAFVHFYAQTPDPYEALRRAIFFASYKIGETGAAQGFLTESGLAQLIDSHAG